MPYPDSTTDERELFVVWLDFLRHSLIKKLEDLDEIQARWRPDGKLTSILGVVNHLIHVEWRWVDGAFGGAETSRPTTSSSPMASQLTKPSADTLHAARRQPTYCGKPSRWLRRARTQRRGTEDSIFGGLPCTSSRRQRDMPVTQTPPGSCLMEPQAYDGLSHQAAIGAGPGASDLGLLRSGILGRHGPSLWGGSLPLVAQAW